MTQVDARVASAESARRHAASQNVPRTLRLESEFQQTEETMRALQRTLHVLFTVVAFSAVAAHATTLTIDIASEPGATPGRVLFTGTGNTIDFPNATDGFDFSIVGSSDPALIGLKGNLSGPFTIGSISTFGSLQTASVSNTGSFSIFDGSNTFSADLKLIDVATVGTGIILNTSGTPNLSNFSYAGGNSTLLSLLGSLDPTVVLTGQFALPKSLTALTNDGAVNSSVYSGTIAATVPEPSSYLLLAAGLMAAAASMRSRRVD
jgi:hypothetical protein